MPGDGGSPIQTYTVTANPGGQTATAIGASATQATVTGLIDGTTYTFTVVATNQVGDSNPGGPSNPVTPSGNVPPSAPQSPSATPGDGQATVTWTDPASSGSSAIIDYTATASPGGSSATASSPTATAVTVMGLTNGTSYTFTVTARSTAGSSAASAPTASVTPRGVPTQPTAVAGVGGDTQAAVSWTAPTSANGSPILDYTVTATPGGATQTVTTTFATVTGLTNGTSYTFAVTARNAAGSSAPSTPSAAVVPGGILDTFNRTVAAGGWGTADTGQAWGALAGAGTAFSVTPSTGLVVATAGGVGIVMPTVSQLASEIVFDILFPIEPPSGNTTYCLALLRGTNTTPLYRLGCYVTSTGAIGVLGQAVVSGVATTIISPTTVAGLAWSATQWFTLKAQAGGSSTTTLKAKVWVQGGAEPGSWAATGVDTGNVGPQVTGPIGVFALANSGNPTVKVDNFHATTVLTP